MDPRYIRLIRYKLEAIIESGLDKGIVASQRSELICKGIQPMAINKLGRLYANQVIFSGRYRNMKAGIDSNHQAFESTIKNKVPPSYKDLARGRNRNKFLLALIQNNGNGGHARQDDPKCSFHDKSILYSVIKMKLRVSVVSR
jgi:hypothetical protein